MDIPVYDIEIQGLAEQIKLLKGYDAIADRELTQAMHQSVITLESAIKPLVPVFRGRLRGSIGSQVIKESAGSIVGKVGTSLKDEVYPLVMEFGREPGAKMPPPSALERWVHLVLGVSDDDAPGVALVVARNIARRGIKGRFFMKKGYDASKGRIVGYFNAALQRIAQQVAIRGGGGGL